jgi:hypothetical protein
VGILAAIAFLWPGLTMQKNLAVAATPTPVALQYDQIVRMVLPPATPPAPGAFAADYASIVGAPAGTAPVADAAAATPTPAPKKRGGIGGFISSVVSGQPPGGSPEDAGNAPPAVADAMRAMRSGTLTRYTYYKGWLRTDDVAHQTAVISKCREHQYITLDLAKKTYTIADTKPACNTRPEMPMGPRPAQVENEASGTVDMTIANTVQNLGPMTIETIATNGYDNALQMSMTNATGSCRNAAMGMNMLQYVSKIPLPHRFCPLPQGAGSYDPSSIVRGGCKPVMHASGGGAAAFDMDKLVMFSKITVNASGGAGDSRMAGFANVTERGNVKWFSGAPADALFTIPPGFTKAG